MNTPPSSRMHRKSALLLLALSALGTSPAIADAAGASGLDPAPLEEFAIPDYLLGAPPPDSLVELLGADPYLLWIASGATELTGTREELEAASPFFGDMIHFRMELARKEAPECYEEGRIEPLVVGTIPDRSTFEKSIKTSRHVLTARVLGKRAGFHASVPGTLYAIEIDEMLYGEVSPSTHYFFRPVGRIDFDGGCYVKTDDRFQLSPEIGDRILLLTYPSPTGEPTSPFLQLHHGDDLAILHENGEVEFQRPATNGPGMRIHPKRFKQEVLAQIRSWLHARKSAGESEE